MDGGTHPARPPLLSSPVHVLLDSSLWVRYRFPLRLLLRFTGEEEVYTLREKKQKFKGKNMKRRWKRLRRPRDETLSRSEGLCLVAPHSLGVSSVLPLGYCVFFSAPFPSLVLYLGSGKRYTEHSGKKRKETTKAKGGLKERKRRKRNLHQLPSLPLLSSPCYLFWRLLLLL